MREGFFYLMSESEFAELKNCQNMSYVNDNIYFHSGIFAKRKEFCKL